MTIIYIPVEIIDKKQSRFRSENDLPSLALFRPQTNEIMITRFSINYVFVVVLFWPGFELGKAVD